MRPLDKHYQDDQVISLIEQNQLLIDLYGRWPKFIDSEIVELNLARGNLLEYIRNNIWKNQKAPSIKCLIKTFDDRFSDNDPMRKESLVTIIFEGIGELSLNGFNHQNPICNMEISRAYDINLKTEVFKVAWGGSALQHDVNFICNGIKVESVVLLDAGPNAE